MKVIVTGGAGFLGQLLIRALCERGRLSRTDGGQYEIQQIVSIDQAQAGPLFVDERVSYVVGDIANPTFLSHVLGRDTDSVFHLAAVVSGGAEADFDLGMRVNLDGTRALLEICRAQTARPRVVFASSVAVFGAPLPDVVSDDTAPRPQTSYGTQKLIGECLLNDYARKGFLDGRALRLPTIVVRPGKANAAASGFASAIIREPLAGCEVTIPVPRETAMWVSSPQSAVAAFIHAHELPEAAWGSYRALNLPGLTVTMAQALEALREVGGEAAAARVRFAPDDGIMRIVRTWPTRFETPRADAMGFPRDADLVGIVRAYARQYAPAVGR
ncbi:MAG: SDR family oxidoreductase [Sutterellaceae bacterium]|nr:SDR family oxidoreductase [Burkholderiaceae bacterium]MCX7901412.1 SDR family oxidoreductase [Burkholderiaceae bacterium]MDW8431002.1 SDR family oxidoreductase [Sutterellaceae bacterium]